MIKKFRHKGLRKLFETGIVTGIQPGQSIRIRRILALLSTANTPEDMALPGLNLHELKGDRKGTWSVNVSGNWRITFKIDNGEVYEIDYEDYH